MNHLRDERPEPGRPPLDLDDADWAPIHGVTLDRYVDLTAVLAREHRETTPDWLEDQGIAPGTWAEIQAGWTDRLARRPAVRARYRLLRDR